MLLSRIETDKLTIAMTAPLLKRRCAVYIRKSTDEGLDQAFNSLDAQREACEAYVASQRGEGWILVGDRYDDGGYSSNGWMYARTASACGCGPRV